MVDNLKSDFISWLFAMLFIIGVVFIAIMAIRWYNNAATVITETKYDNGVACYMATSSDGVALSCLKVGVDDQSRIEK